MSRPRPSSCWRCTAAAGQADALAAYRRLHRTLDEELGIYPSLELRDLEAAILRQDPALDAPAAAASLTQAAPAVPVPAQLPPAVPAFAGRGAELARLDALLPPTAGPGRAGPGPAVTPVLSGTAGVGKTTLAVHWAHRVADAVPGRAAVRQPARLRSRRGRRWSRARRSVGSWRRSGCPRPGSRPTLPAQAALYRSLLAGKRVLVVLDNARDVEQVRPLLPGSPGCLAVVTSRDRLTGLVATDGAFPLTLDLLPAADARDLLARRLGPGRVASEPAAVDDIIAGCARLPLALTIAAARAAAQPQLPAGRARRRTARRDRTRSTRSRAAISPPMSGRCSPGPTARSARGAARLFRLLGLHPGPDIGRRRGGQPGRGPAGPGAGAAGRADPRAPAGRVRPGPVRVPRPAPRVRRRAGASPGQPGRPRRGGAPGAGPLPAHRPPGRDAAGAAFHAARP